MRQNQSPARRRFYRPPVADAIDQYIKRASLVRVAAKVNVVGEARLGVITCPVSEVVAPVDGPVIAGANFLATGRAVAKVRDEESTLTRLFFKGLIKERKIHERHTFQVKPRVAGDGMVSGHDFEGGPFQPPPGARQRAIGQEAIMEHVVILEALSPFALKIKWILSSEKSPASLNASRRSARHVIELSSFGVDVVFGPFAVQLFAAHEEFKMDVTTSLD